MPVKPNFLERVAFFTTNAAPGALLDLAGALAYQTLSTAVQLDIFPELEEQPGTAAELAGRLHSQERGMVALLEALESIGYVEQQNGRYANSKMTRKWLLDNKAFDTASLLAYWNAALRDLWSFAPQVLRSGERPYDFYEWVEADPDLAHSFQQTMVMSANTIGPDIAKKLKLPCQMDPLACSMWAAGMACSASSYASNTRNYRLPSWTVNPHYKQQANK